VIKEHNTKNHPPLELKEQRIDWLTRVRRCYTKKNVMATKKRKVISFDFSSHKELYRGLKTLMDLYDLSRSAAVRMAIVAGLRTILKNK
jgi:hypothetical protein